MTVPSARLHARRTTEHLEVLVAHARHRRDRIASHRGFNNFVGFVFLAIAIVGLVTIVLIGIAAA